MKKRGYITPSIKSPLLTDIKVANQPCDDLDNEVFELGDPSTNKHQIQENISFTKLKHTKTSLSRSSHGWLATLMSVNNGLLMEGVM
jgi:hypothetical protein